MNLSEDTLVAWSTGPGETEATKCENAERLIRKAINQSDALNALDIRVFSQGSYRARTNVPRDSDVDICVCLKNNFFADYPNNGKHQDYGNVDGQITYANFKNLVGIALTDYFGNKGVTRGNKAFDVHENTYRIDADVVAAFEHRRYDGQVDANANYNYLEGIAFLSDKGDLIKNWPEHNYGNGVNKNFICKRHYKRVIRILKRLSYEMRDADNSAAQGIGSFLIECLVWNAPNNAFTHQSYTDDVRAVLLYVWQNTQKLEDCKEWGEVNELKYLFNAHQPWTFSQVNSFIAAAWNYMGYK